MRALVLIFIAVICASCSSDVGHADPCAVPDAELIVVIDNMSCSTCIIDVVEAINNGTPHTIAILASQSNYPHIAKLLSAKNVLLISRPTSDLQRCFPSPTNASINRRTKAGLERLMDINIENSGQVEEVIG